MNKAETRAVAYYTGRSLGLSADGMRRLEHIPYFVFLAKAFLVLFTGFRETPLGYSLKNPKRQTR